MRTNAESCITAEKAQSGAALLTARQVAELLQISPRSVYRLSDSGHIPKPQKVGTTLSRWSRAELEKWINDGCKPSRTSKSAK